MTGRAVPPHYLRENASEWSPSRVVCLDTESKQTPTRRGRLHTYRLGIATLDHRDTPGVPDHPEATAVAWEDPAELWRRIDLWTTTRRVTWCFAHNLAFDLTVSRGLLELHRLGWEMKSLSTIPRSPFARLTRGRRSLVLADSVSWFPASIEQVGRTLGLSSDVTAPEPDTADTPAGRRRDLEKLPMPADAAGAEAWEAYCHRDVAILRQAVLELLEWWDAERCGRWAITGATTGWALFRHRHLGDKALVHRDPDATVLERAASYGGRREAFRTGAVDGGPFPYVDFAQHYARVATRTALPVRWIRNASRVDLARYRARNPGIGIIAEAVVRTDRPVVPVRHDGRVLYPVGTFRTTLASPELDLLLETGADVELGPAALYGLRPWLAGWGTWAVRVLEGLEPDVPPVVRLAVKGWSRSVFGKLGQAGRVTRDIGETLPWLFRISPTVDAETGNHGTLAEVGGRVLETVPGGEPDNAMPGVHAFLLSQARVDLWRLLEAAGPDRVVWCDTDAVIIDGSDAAPPTAQDHVDLPDGAETILDPAWWISDAGLASLPDVVRVKAVHRHLRIHLPGDYRVDGRPVVRGLPSGASPTGPRAFRAELWPGLPWQLGAHGGEAFETWTRDLSYVATYRGRYVMADGRTFPPELELGPDGTNRLLSWDRSRWGTAGLQEPVSGPA